MPCGSSRCSLACFECDCQRACRQDPGDQSVEDCIAACPACSVVPAPDWVSSYFVPANLGQFTISFCPAYDDYTAAVTACFTTYLGHVSDCADAKTACLAGCAGDIACQRGCEQSYYLCLAPFISTRYSCELTAWNTDEADLLSCAEKTVVGSERLSTCCGDSRFSTCIAASDSAYFDTMWPLAVAFEQEVIDLEKTYQEDANQCLADQEAARIICDSAEASCQSGCAGNPVCEAACTDTYLACTASALADGSDCQSDAFCTRRSEQLLLRSDFLDSEKDAATVRNSARATCIGTELTSPDTEHGRPKLISCGGSYLQQLKSADLSAQADKFTLAADATRCEEACPCVPGEDLTYEFSTCRGQCNIQASLQILNIESNRMENRKDSCVHKYPDAVHDQGYAECRLPCDQLAAACPQLCESAFATCTTTCCVDADPEACAERCADDRICCLGDGGFPCEGYAEPTCADDYEGCLSDCTPAGEFSQDGECIKTCADTFYSCVTGPLNFSPSSSPVTNACPAQASQCIDKCNKVFRDCPSCYQDASTIDNDFLCLPSSFNYDLTFTPVVEVLCD